MKIEVVLNVQDKDCPKCKFPETLGLRNKKTGELIGEMCSSFRSGKCTYFVVEK